MKIKKYDRVVIKSGAADKSYLNTGLYDRSKAEEECVGNVLYVERDIICVETDRDDTRFWWNPDYIELYDVNREEMLDIERVL